MCAMCGSQCWCGRAAVCWCMLVYDVAGPDTYSWAVLAAGCWGAWEEITSVVQAGCDCSERVQGGLKNSSHLTTPSLPARVSQKVSDCQYSMIGLPRWIICKSCICGHLVITQSPARLLQLSTTKMVHLLLIVNPPTIRWKWVFCSDFLAEGEQKEAGGSRVLKHSLGETQDRPVGRLGVCIEMEMSDHSDLMWGPHSPPLPALLMLMSHCEFPLTRLTPQTSHLTPHYISHCDKLKKYNIKCAELVPALGKKGKVLRADWAVWGADQISNLQESCKLISASPSPHLIS